MDPGFVPKMKTSPVLLSMGRHAYSRLSHREVEAKALNVSLKVIMPAILASSALLYQQGLINTNGQSASYDWAKSIREAVIGSWVIQNTRGLFPLFGILFSAYEAGKQGTEADKLKALATTVPTMLFGWTGVKVMQGYQNSRLAEDYKALYHVFHPVAPHAQKSLKHWFDRCPDHVIDETRALLTDEKGTPLQHPLKPTLQQLSETLHGLFSAKGAHHGNPPLEVLQQHHARLSELQQGIVTYAELLYETRVLHDKQAMQHLIATTRHIQNPARRLNNWLCPAFGYIIAGMLLSTPVSNWLKNRIDKRSLKIQPAIDSTGFNRLTTQASLQGSGVSIPASLQVPVDCLFQF
jgi:hypothetical protein